MPGSPPISPRFSAPRYSDAADTAAFASQLNAVTDAFDVGAEKIWTPHSPGTSATLVDRDETVISAGHTATLPAAVVGASCRVVSDTNVTGPSPVVISRAGADLIVGKGLSLSGVSSFNFGAPVTALELVCFATGFWVIVGGEQDSGWIPVAPAASVTTPGSSNEVLASRIKGDRVEFRGSVHANSLSSGAQIGNLGSTLHEAGAITRTSLTGTSGLYPVRFQGTNTAIFVDAACSDTNVCFDGYFYYLP